MSVNSKMTAIANPIRTLMGKTNKLGMDAMASDLGNVVGEVDTQSTLIQRIKTALEDKSAAGYEEGYSQGYAEGGEAAIAALPVYNGEVEDV